MNEIDLLLIDDDPVFQLGLRAALAENSDLNVIATTDPANALESLSAIADDRVLVTIVEWATLEPEPPLEARSRLFEQLKEIHPNSPILLLSFPLDARSRDIVRAAGVDGYCFKGSPITTIIEAIRQLASGQSYEQNLPPLPAKRIRRAPGGKVSQWLYANCQAGLAQMDDRLESLNTHLKNPQLPAIDRLFWSGQQRELRVARWLVQQLQPETIVLLPETNKPQEFPEPAPLVPRPPAPLVRSQSLRDRVLEKIQQGVENRSGSVLEIDILQPEKRKELLYAIAQEIEDVLEELRFLKTPPEELAERQGQILQQIWQSATLEFFSKYYAPTNPNYPIVELLLRTAPQFQRTTLNRIPFIPELFAHLLHDLPLTIDNVPYRSESPEAQARAEILLENLILRVANSIMQLLLNTFAEEESIKYILYDRPYLSSREIARLRNDLSWKYRQTYYLEEPKAIFESRYRLLKLEGNRIQPLSLSAPRLAELKQLKGLRWLVTIALEARDAIAPRVRATVAILGQGVVYLLTQVLGKGIGLIGRGMLQGLGNAFQDTRYRKNSSGDRGEEVTSKETR
ncbi:DUF3685 domain-containing protein [Lusitaniella coriacea]|uniref:DUF3685 domain-containing protein n=1 Tax=Lusitaniella coriacea TaxID=1983105 RepID=UPI003CF2443D